MKKSIKYTILLGVLCMIGFSSCVNEDKDLFDKPSAQRLNEALKNYNELLCSSPDGWAMEYFPNENEQGYTFLMRFDKNSAVDMASKNKWTNNVVLEKSSLFEMIADNGPVLTFDTYNEVIHFFSNPEDIGSTKDDEAGKGFEGDYEFVVVKADKDLITLKGKKRNLDIFLRRLPVGQVWSEYFKKLDDVDKSLFSPKINSLILNAGDEKYTVTNASNHILYLVIEGGDAISQTLKAPFIVLSDGIRLVKPFKGYNDKISISEFKIAEDGSLVSPDDTKARLAAPEPSELISSENYSWRIDKNSLGGKFVDAYAKVVEQSKSEFKSVFTYFQFKYDGASSNQTLSFKNGKYSGMIYIKMESANINSVKFSSQYLGDNNGTIHMQKAPAYKEFLDLLCSSEYTITNDSAMSPNKLTFVSKTTPADKFVADIQ